MAAKAAPGVCEGEGMSKNILDGSCNILANMLAVYKHPTQKATFKRRELQAFMQTMREAWDTEHPGKDPIITNSDWQLMPEHTEKDDEGVEQLIPEQWTCHISMRLAGG